MEPVVPHGESSPSNRATSFMSSGTPGSVRACSRLRSNRCRRSGSAWIARQYQSRRALSEVDSGSLMDGGSVGSVTAGCRWSGRPAHGPPVAPSIQCSRSCVAASCVCRHRIGRYVPAPKRGDAAGKSTVPVLIRVAGDLTERSMPYPVIQLLHDARRDNRIWLGSCRKKRRRVLEREERGSSPPCVFPLRQEIPLGGRQYRDRNIRSNESNGDRGFRRTSWILLGNSSRSLL